MQRRIRVAAVSPSSQREWWHDEWDEVRELAPARAVSALSDHRADIVIVDARRSEPLHLVNALAIGSTAPVVVYGAAADAWLAMRFLDAGAADYLTPLMTREELAARVRAAARRRRGAASEDAAIPSTAWALGRVFISSSGDEIWADGRPVHLTRNESALLRLLADEPGNVVTYHRLIRALWGEAAPPTAREYLRAYARRLREKIEVDPERPTAVVTVRGQGYRLVTETGTVLDAAAGA